MRIQKRETIAWFSWWLGWVAYAVFSYALTAPNLILSHFEPYWQFQTWMWQTFFNHRPLLTYTFIGLITYLSFTSGWLMWHLARGTWQPRWFWLVLGGLTILGANNALSYDVFNYIFNAKMVLVYHANPHVRVALDFAAIDDWTRFMHNTHTPAPYGYGWTLWSLIPFGLGLGKFTLTWEWFRVWSGVSLIMTASASRWLAKNWWGTTSPAYAKWQRWQWVLWLNPLLLIELITNSHNDWWMMAPAVWAMAATLKGTQSTRTKSVVGWWLAAALALGLSTTIKYATLALIPVWGSLLLYHWSLGKTKVAWLYQNWPWLASLSLFVPLLSSRSQLFHPWYLTWSLVWLSIGVVTWLSAPAATTWLTRSLHQLQGWWWITLVCFSLTSLFRYVPYLWLGEYTPTVLLHQQIITWSAVPLATGLYLGGWLYRRLRNM